MDPVYLSSIIVGSLYHGTHLMRAMYGRIKFESSVELPASYHLNFPLLSPVSNPETRSIQKATSFAYVWLIADGNFNEKCPLTEVISTTSGKLENGVASKLCKAEMFRLFIEVMKASCNYKLPATYADAKLMATEYQQVKAMLYDSFKKSMLGTWVKKPLEQDQFQ